MDKYKFYNQPINSFLKGINDFQNECVVFLDTETTGLKGPKIEQLTQISAIATTYDDGAFSPLGSFNQKITLNAKTKNRIKLEPEAEWNVKNILVFNHYNDWDQKYISELAAIKKLFKWLETIKYYHQKNILLTIQNANFDMTMIHGRSQLIVDYPTLDTKHIIQFQLLPLIQTLAETDTKYKKMLDRIGTSKSNRDNGLPSSSLSNIAKGFEITTENNHDAMTDCLILMDVLDNILQLLSKNSKVNIEKYQTILLNTKA